MDYRNLGRTGVRVSPLCLGTMMFGRSTNEQDSIAVIEHALDHGINFIDTANAYSAGASEQFVGKALGQGRRARVVLATKAFFPQDQKDPNARGLSRRHLIEACDASLKRLQTDWIDLYQVHRPQADIPIDETLRALDDLIRHGKVRYIGTSMFPAWKSVEALWAAKEFGLNRFVSEQMAYNLLDRTAEREVIPAAQTFGLALIPWAPLCGGLLTGKYRRDDQSAAGRWHGGKDNFGRPATPGGVRRDRGARRARERKRLHAVAARARVECVPARHHRTDHRSAHARAARRQSRCHDRQSHRCRSRAARCARTAVVRNAALLRRRHGDRLSAEPRALVGPPPHA